MSAVITLLASITIALFFIGPFLAARFALETLVIKQPARTQSSTEELARSLFFSIPFVFLASVSVWLAYRNGYVVDNAAIDSLFGSGSTPSARWAAIDRFWPVRVILLVTYLEVVLYVMLVYGAVKLLPGLTRSDARLSPYYLCTKLASPYLKSGWDVIAGRILLPAGTKASADVATKSGKIYMGTLADVKTSPDGSLVHIELSNPVIRAESVQVPAAGSSDSQETSRKGESYTFRDSFYFVIFAAEIANINLRFEGPPQPRDMSAMQHTKATRPGTAPVSGVASAEPQGRPPERTTRLQWPEDMGVQPVSRKTLDVLSELDPEEGRRLLIELGLDGVEDT